MTTTTDLTIRETLSGAGYSDAQIDAGLQYADARQATGEAERLSLALSRILYDDAALADGARHSVEA